MVLSFTSSYNFSRRYNKYLQGRDTELLNKTLANAANEHHNGFIEQLPFAVAIVDKNLKYVMASNKWITDHQLSGQAIIGSSHQIIFGPSNPNRKKIYASCLKGKISTGAKERIQKPDGSFVWIKWDIRPYYNYQNEIAGLFIFTEDITRLILDKTNDDKALEILKKTSEVARIGTWNRNFVTKTMFWDSITQNILELPDNIEIEFDAVLNFYKTGKSRKLVEKVSMDALKKGTPFDIVVDVITYQGNTKKIRIIAYSDFNNGFCEKLGGVFIEVPGTNTA